MQRIDAHQHFWKFNPIRDTWIDDSMATIRRDFLPEDLQPILAANGITGTVVVQSDQSPSENIFQLENAEQYSFIKGVIGWVHLKAADLERQLDALSAYPKLKGFRHVLQAEDPNFMLAPAFIKGLGHLSTFNFTYDLLLFPRHLSTAARLVSQLPYQQFVLDHLGKPEIKAGRLDEWKNDLLQLATFPNVFCKLSGLVTEASWTSWKPDDLRPYIDVVMKAFGTKRVMFGSDWPVCLLAGSYEKVTNLVADYCAGLSTDEQADIWANNAISFYHLS